MAVPGSNNRSTGRRVSWRNLIFAALWALIAAAGVFVLASTANAALIGRAPTAPSGTDYLAYYDTTLDVTWLTDANLAQSLDLGVTGIAANGAMTWETAGEWLAALNSSSYLGENSWRLPQHIDIPEPGSTVPDGCAVNAFATFAGHDCGYNVIDSGVNAAEMASIFHQTLGNLAALDENGNPAAAGGLQNTGPFENLQFALYWYGQDDVTDSEFAWYFGMPSGGQRPRAKTSLHHVWAVTDGDPLAAVPLPPTFALFVFSLCSSAIFSLRNRRLRQNDRGRS